MGMDARQIYRCFALQRPNNGTSLNPRFPYLFSFAIATLDLHHSMPSAISLPPILFAPVLRAEGWMSIDLHHENLSGVLCQIGS